MIHFLEQHFVELVTITSIIYLTLATILLLYQTPDTAVYKTFRRSKTATVLEISALGGTGIQKTKIRRSMNRPLPLWMGYCRQIYQPI